ncbi:AAA family ATPase [Krasilnikovia sp. MM14-A1004]|uniref:helix-turn-helix transcriptional regulator n=1 Tax=Krasilnikovia sp. MM14-A1004 TaxID=3373541 RepID=UPI00399C91C7
MQPDETALFGRASLLAAIEGRLAAGGGVAVHGPAGIGKTALLDAVSAAATARGDLVLRLRPARTERALPYAGIADLVDQVPPDAAAALPPAQRAALAALRQGVSSRTAGTALARRLVLPLLLAQCARLAPVLLVLDDVQWLDAESAELIGFAMRRRPGPRVRVLAAQRCPSAVGRRRAVRLCPAPVSELAVPPLSADDLTALLEAHGLPCRTASRLHEASGGNPFLALALGAATPPGPAWRPAPLPEPARALLRERVAALPAEVADTLLLAALDTEPTATVLIRAGREDAERELRLAAAAGAVELDGDAIRFVPPALAQVLAEDAGAARRAEAHGALAAAAVGATEAVRHRALQSGRPDPEVARALAAEAQRAAGRGAGRSAAELYLLAADRCPHALAAHRLDWLVAAARTAATAGAPALAGRAAEAVLAAEAPPEHRVRARLVLLDLAGQALADMGEMFAAALVEAGDDPALLGPVRLRLTWAAMVAGDLDATIAEAGRTVTAARLAGDPTTEAMVLSTLAQAQRLRGEPEWTHTLQRALALPAEQVPGWLHLGPRYLAARFAMVDDRLDEARADLLRLLAVAEQDRTGEALVEVLRSLSEVATRAARCRDALRYAHRAVACAQRAGLSPGPTWYTAAVAELAGGSLAAAAGFARRGVRASEQEGDSIFLPRNLHALGQAELRAGNTRAGVDALRRLRELESVGATDPMIVRWHGDLAGGLAALGEHAEAAATLAEARAAAYRLAGTPGMAGYLDRATAVVLSESGQADSAVVLSAAAARHFEQLRQPIEQGYALLVQGGAERRRRRYAAARVAIGAALTIFLQVEAKPWAEQTERALAGTSAPATGTSSPADLGLTSMEARVAALVRDGASNREIATRLFLSVKTVEATLTRVYRKVGVRSRTQLSSRLTGMGLVPGGIVAPPVRPAVDA